jgi:hypothetical protein
LQADTLLYCPKQEKRKVQKMQLNLGKVKGKDGENVFIKYADDIYGAGATDSWSPGKKCIGITTSSDSVKPETGYTWAKFVGDDGANGADGKTCYIKYNTLPQDSGAVPTWSAGQTCIGFKLSSEATAPSTGYNWFRAIPDIKQTAGTNTTDIMSQKAVTDLLNGKTDKSQIKQSTGTGTADIMSQKAVTDLLGGKADKNRVQYDIDFWGTASVPVINMNKGDGGCCALLFISHHSSAGNNTRAEVHLVRGFYDGANNQSPTDNVAKIAGSGSILNLTWSINGSGYLVGNFVGGATYKITVIGNYELP